MINSNLTAQLNKEKLKKAWSKFEIRCIDLQEALQCKGSCDKFECFLGFCYSYYPDLKIQGVSRESKKYFESLGLDFNSEI